MQSVTNLTAVCLDTKSDSEIVLHEVSFDLDTDGVVESIVKQMYARDPMDAIDTILRRYS